jgi:hypothetical protein
MTEQDPKSIDEQIKELESRVETEREALRMSEAALSAARESLAGAQQTFNNPLRRVIS